MRRGFVYAVTMPQRFWPLLLCCYLLVAQVSDRARTLHQDALVFDAHVHAVDREFYHGGDIGERKSHGQWDLSRARGGGVGPPFVGVHVPAGSSPGPFDTTTT